MELRNRVAIAPCVENYSNRGGEVTDQLLDYYEERARAGVGLIIVEAISIAFPEGRVLTRQLSIDNDGRIPGLRRLAQTIQRHGVPAIPQINHGGIASRKLITGLQPVGPSAVGFPDPTYDTPRAITIPEIEGYIQLFAKAAVRVKEAGFAGVEVHCCHRYLPANFLMTAYNKRADKYGGELRNRARFALDIVRAVRQAVGPDYPVLVRINTRHMYNVEGVEGEKTTFEEAKQVARWMQETGADAIDLSIHLTEGSSPIEPGGNIPWAGELKKVVSVPVIVAGRITPELGEMALREGKADIIALGRGLMVDSEWAKKALSGRPDDIRPCINCAECFDYVLIHHKPVVCCVNPAIGREKRNALKPAERRKRVLVVGGGPAGMEAATTAAIRGHDVTLWEKNTRLGGLLLLAALTPRYDPIQNLTDYLIGQLGKSGVKVECGKEASAESIRDFKPEVLILATGSVHRIPKIPGIDRGNVVTACDVLEGKAETGETVAVIGGELVGCANADFLAHRGKKVTILRRGPELLTKVLGRNKGLLLDRLAANGVVMLTGISYKQITDEGIIIVSSDGVEQTVKVDTIVIATGANPEAALRDATKGMFPEVYSIGDCTKPNRIMQAIHGGARVGRTI